MTNEEFLENYDDALLIGHDKNGNVKIAMKGNADKTAEALSAIALAAEDEDLRTLVFGIIKKALIISILPNSDYSEDLWDSLETVCEKFNIEEPNIIKFRPKFKK